MKKKIIGAVVAITGGMSLLTEVMACPACGSSFATVTGKGSAFDVVAENGLYHHPDYFTVSCRDCFLIYKTKRLSDERLESFYRNGLNYKQLEIPGLFPTERAILGVLRNEKRRLKLLDFGCSSGRLLSRLTKRHDCFGVELNEDAAEAARNNGIEIVTLNEIESQRLSFDVVILADVYEHLQKPLDLLEILLKHVCRRGRLILATGCSDSMRGRNIAQSWYFRTLGHLHMASLEHVKWLESRLSVQRTHLIKCSHYDSRIADRILQVMRSWVYDQVHPKTTRLGRLILKTRVGLKVKSWSAPPAFDLAQDHVVICFQKRDSTVFLKRRVI